MRFELIPIFVGGQCYIPFFNGIGKDVSVGYNDGTNTDELLLYFRVDVGFYHGCVLVYDVEYICNRVGVDVLVMCGIDAFFVKFLVRNIAIGAKEICHEVDDGALKNSCIIIYLGQEEKLV